MVIAGRRVEAFHKLQLLAPLRRRHLPERLLRVLLLVLRRVVTFVTSSMRAGGACFAALARSRPRANTMQQQNTARYQGACAELISFSGFACRYGCDKMPDFAHGHIDDTVRVCVRVVVREETLGGVSRDV